MVLKLLCVLAFIFLQTQAQNDCDIPCVVNREQKRCVLPPIFDNATIDSVLKEWKGSHNIQVASASGPFYPYLDIDDGKNDYFALKLSYDFEYFDEYERGYPDIDMEFTVHYHCNDGEQYDVEYVQKVKDYNTYEPEFWENQYVFRIPMPFPPGFIINDDELIEVFDEDFSNRKITFTVDPPEFDIVDRGIDEEEKYYYAALKTQEWINYDKKEFTLTAIDSGEPPRNSTAKLTIIKDSAISDPKNPSFDKPYYYAKYFVNKDGKGRLENSPTIEITDTWEVSKLKLSDDIHFSANRVYNTIFISVIKNIPEEIIETEAFLLLDLTAIEPNESFLRGNTVIVVELPKSDGKCPELPKPGTCEGRPKYSLIVDNKLSENKKYDNNIEVLEKPSLNYTYKIMAQEPNGFFTINATTGILSTKELDRETNAKHVVTVKLEKSSEETRAFSNTKFFTETNNTDFGECGLKNIELDSSETMIIFEVQDENDNSPKFEENSYIFGYPVKELLDIITPEFIGKVHATDADIGINAEIQYSIQDNVKFNINPKTGVIYANSDFKESKFIVSAIDQDGKGRKTDVEVNIHSLDKTHMVLIKREGIPIEELEGELKTLSNNIGITLKHLTAWTSPVENSKLITKEYAEQHTFEIKVIIYGFDKSNKLVQSSEIQRKMNETSSVKFDTESFKEFVDKLMECKSNECKTCPANECNNTCEEESCGGHVAGIVILALLLSSVIMAVIAFYYYKLRFVIPIEDLAVMLTTRSERQTTN